MFAQLVMQETHFKGGKTKGQKMPWFYKKILEHFHSKESLDCFQIFYTFWKVERLFSDEKETELGEKFQQHFRTMCIHPYYFEKDDLLHWSG